MTRQVSPFRIQFGKTVVPMRKHTLDDHAYLSISADKCEAALEVICVSRLLFD